ncbi:unnamed protein product [Arabidopsis thaliana]|uniref:Outer envelope protein 80, chloroplastic n=1 Tax=Arabidopsis thaliana TaxID=3702 RepID=A0A7G2F8T3_ARATH|nr:unnamed protein product [Arabidopsis thaliana]
MHCHNDDVRFSSSSIRIHSPSPKEQHSLLTNLQSCSKTFVSHLSNTRNSLNQMLQSLKNRHTPPPRSVRRPNLPTQMLNSVTQLMIGKSSPISLSLIQSTQFNWSESRDENVETIRGLSSPLLCCASLSLTRPNESTQSVEGKDTVQQQKGHSVSRNAEERVLISEVLVRTKDGEELERKDLEMEALAALKACRANSALTIREVQEDVHRIIESGYFCSCTPVAVDTRDGIRLMFQNQTKNFVGKVINIKRLEEAITSINGWYMERGLFGIVSDIDTLSGGIVRLQVAEAEVNNISIRFLDRKTGEPTKGKTSPETILRQLTTKKGQVYSMLQGKRDVDTVLAMGIMEDVSIIPQPAGDSGKVDLIMNCVERPSGGFSAGGGISSGITSGPLSGLIGSFAYSHRNLFGRNQKLNVSLERGQIDSIFRINYTDPWIEGDDKRTSRSIMVQNSRTPGNLVHGNQPDNSSLTIGRVTAGVEYSRPFRPKWNGTAGLIFQHAGARDEQGNPIIKDFYSSPLTASGKPHDETMLAKLESIYTGSGDQGSTMFAFNMEQGLPVLPEWLCFNRVTGRARKGIHIGPARFLFSLSGGHVVGKFSPHEAFVIGGTNSVRGYEEGAVGSGRSYVVGSGELSFPVRGPVEGVIFTDYGTDMGSGSTVPGDPAGARLKPGSGYGYGLGVRVDSPLGPLRLEYAFNDQHAGRFHFGVGLRN